MQRLELHTFRQRNILMGRCVWRFLADYDRNLVMLAVLKIGVDNI
jgi:hypothetical protein